MRDQELREAFTQIVRRYSLEELLVVKDQLETEITNAKTKLEVVDVELSKHVGLLND